MNHGLSRSTSRLHQFGALTFIYNSSTVSKKLYGSMEVINLLNNMVAIIIPRVSAVELILSQVFENFDFNNEPGLLQYWAFNRDSGCNLVLTNITRNPTQDQGLEDYRMMCFENVYPSIGIQISVGNWLAGRSAQTRIADQKTTHHVVDQHDQYSDDVGARGQLVLPVYYVQGGVIRLVGVTEYVTPEPKESYVDDFEQFHDLLEDGGLKSTYVGKTVKVVYNSNTIRFPLPLEAELTDLHTEVTMRFPELHHQIYRVEYNTTEGIRRLFSTDNDLQVCLAESSSRGSKFIRMFVSVEKRGEAMKGLIRESYGIANANSELIPA